MTIRGVKTPALGRILTEAGEYTHEAIRLAWMLLRDLVRDVATLNHAAELARSVVAVTGNVTLTTDNRYVHCDASGGAFAVTLPAAAAASGVPFFVKKTDSSVNAVTVTATIDGDSNFDLELEDEMIGPVVSDGTEYWIMG